MIQYKFQNGTLLKILKKLIIMAINPLVCYLIKNMNYVKLWLIIKLMFIAIEFEIIVKASCTYDGTAKPRRKIRPS